MDSTPAKLQAHLVLDTHLKRHFEQDEHFQKCSSGGARTHSYKVSIYCFREICQYARHSERRARAQYWIKVIDETTGGDFMKERNKVKSNKKHKGGSGGGKKRYAAPSYFKRSTPDTSEKEDSDNADSYGDEESDYSNGGCLSNSSSFDESDYAEIESQTSSLLSTLSQHFANELEPDSPTSLYNYSISSSTPPKPRVRKDFASVSILNRKRKAFEDPAWNEPGVDDASSSARPNLRLLSELALGLR